MQVNEEITQEEHMLTMLRSEREDLEGEVCQFRIKKAKLLQQIAYVVIWFRDIIYPPPRCFILSILIL